MLSFCLFVGCNKERPKMECPTFTELPDPTADTLSDWSNIPAGLHASLVSIDVKYRKSVAPQLETVKKTSLTGWKGERVSGQLLLWTAEDIKQAECTFSDFISPSGKLSSDIAQTRFVRYVITDIFEPGCGYRKPEDFPSSLVPDMLDNLDCFDITAKTVRPVWLTINKNTDGTWAYDYTIFDKWVEFMMNLGINKMINCYSVIPWKSGIHYKDTSTKQMVDVEVIPGTKVFEEMWTPFLKDFKKHLEEKGWLQITNIAMDERGPKEMKLTMDFLHKVAPELGVSLADNHKSYKQYPYIKDMSVGADAKVDSVDIQFRREKGLITTYYVCCSDKFPNMFTCSELPEGVYAAWYCMAAGYDGFLRWAYNSWVENPLTDSRFVTWPAGDTYIVYPEARSSMRFERLMEGIQDAEKIRLLRKEFVNNPEKLKTLEDEVAKFNTIEPTGYVDMIHQAKEVLNKLSE